MLSEKLFYHGTEGYLGDTEDCKLLFLMREPNCGDGQIACDNYFWFREVVHGKQLPWSWTYLSKLGHIATLVLKTKGDETKEVWSSALQQSVYININPTSGKGTNGNDYMTALNDFAEGPGNRCSVNGQDYPNRWDTILNMPDGSTLVTVGDVYSKMFDWFNSQGEIVSVMNSHLHIRTKRGTQSMRSFDFQHGGKAITVLETYHPTARGKSSFQWQDISICRKEIVT